MQQAPAAMSWGAMQMVCLLRALKNATGLWLQVRQAASGSELCSHAEGDSAESRERQAHQGSLMHDAQVSHTLGQMDMWGSVRCAAALRPFLSECQDVCWLACCADIFLSSAMRSLDLNFEEAALLVFLFSPSVSAFLLRRVLRKWASFFELYGRFVQVSTALVCKLVYGRASAVNSNG
jgi:hypothetical protein